MPSLKSIDIKNSLVDIKLYERNMNSESQPSRELATLASNIPNTGLKQILVIPKPGSAVKVKWPRDLLVPAA